MPMTQWNGCYDDSWKDLITPESFCHPAKMSKALLDRILAHAAEQGWLKQGDTIVDPFGGIGSTGILGAYKGYRVVCVELEKKFADLTEQNFQLHDNAWRKLGCPRPVIIQGDSRKLSQLIEQAGLIISSPPYEGARIGQESGQEQCGHNDAYGQTKGQLGSMKSGSVDAVISSPPYADGNIQQSKRPETENTKRIRNICGAGVMEYGQTSGNLGNMKSGDVSLILSSPPYAASFDKYGKDNNKTNKGIVRPSAYGQTPGQLASMSDFAQGRDRGNKESGFFWQAAKEIVVECHKILKPSGYAIWVVKAFVRNKKIVDFPGDWRRLCEALGFVTVCEHHASLVKETKHNDLFEGEIVKKTERKSFFRRLAEDKGSPKIDYETVLCMRKL